MTVILWIIQKLSPIIFWTGALTLLFELANGDFDIEPYMYIIGGASALVGFILGLTNWALDIPPKFFWTKSRVELLDNRFSNALGYALIFFNIPFCVIFIISTVEHFT